MCTKGESVHVNALLQTSEYHMVYQYTGTCTLISKRRESETDTSQLATPDTYWTETTIGSEGEIPTL